MASQARIVNMMCADLRTTLC
eukprot:COSAG02_NODE_47925_length_337_cov_1.563025_1_plen_20_part_10